VKKRMSFGGEWRIRTRVRSVARRILPYAPQPLILMYHRIAEEPVDPWGLAVSPAHFEEHLRVLRRKRYPLRLDEFVNRLVAGTLPPRAVALTFDDGYVDNLTAGKPRLADADVPATVFLATGFVDSPAPFWWDELANLILLEKCPQRFALVIRGESVQFDFGTEKPRGEDSAVPPRSLEQRHSLLSRVWQSLRLLNDEERRPVMAELRSVFGEPDGYTGLGRAMTRGEVRTLARDGLVTIGAHSVSHPILSELETSICRREVAESKLACENLTEARVTAFAYPFGDFDFGAQEAVRAAGFTVACSTHHTAVGVKSDIFALPRIQIVNMDGEDFERSLRMAPRSS
jgi:peptidoglycan/xylan/chitin deacetylase (PgdA/CDA1 family)